MSDHAATVRDALQRVHSVDDYGHVYEGHDAAALAALDALVAERDEAERREGHMRNLHDWRVKDIDNLHVEADALRVKLSLENARAEAAEAETARLREALETICNIGETRDVEVARAALGKTPA